MTAQLEILLPTAATHGFDYLAPEGMVLNAGDIVTVPFGRGESLGVVWGEGTAKIAPGKLKNIAARHAQFPPLSDAARRFIDWAAWYNCAPKGAILKMALPVADIAREGRAHVETAIDLEKLALAPLSGIQAEAAATLKEKIGHGFSVTLLDGVTGSGKTEVYFAAIATALSDKWQVASGKEEFDTCHLPLATYHSSQILILLPEIALSVQWLERFEARFGFKPVVWNSQVTPARKRASWQAIATGAARVVVGARSALFLPYRQLGLIVVDEEHDPSYKQEEGVIYHARDMAVARARFEGLPIALVSATPSLESYYNVRQGKYGEISLPSRHGVAGMPAIELLDMRHIPIERGAFISGPLRRALADAIGHGHQALLFLNRRGYAPLMLCRHCGHRFQCPHCAAWLVLHKGVASKEASSHSPLATRHSSLQCHHCNHRIAVPKACPECGAEDSLHACGPGVERVHEEALSFLPQARIKVMASDQLEGEGALAGTIAAMSDKRIDLLIGTQMIAKGHHFADLAVVGVVDADLGLSGGDLRASERTYQLLHQLSGRAGRETVKGRVYLQSFLPGHPVMKALISGDRDAFLHAELQARKNADMPPFSRLAAIIVEGEKEEQVIKAAQQLAATAPHDARGTIHVLGPAPAPLSLLRGKFRYRLLAKASRTVNLPDTMRAWVAAQSPPSSVRIKIDIDPVSFM